MNKPFTDYQSPLATAIQAFLACHRALGKRFDNEESALRLLDRYLTEKKIESVDAISGSLLDDFLISRPRNSRSYNHLLNVLQRFFDWLVKQQKIISSPLHSRSRKGANNYIPYIFTPDQFKQLLSGARSLPDNRYIHDRCIVYPMIFILMYGLGLRVSEATGLCRADINMGRQYLVIRETKFAKSRLVPFGPKIAACINEYLQGHTENPPDSLLFSFSKNPQCPVCRQTVSRTFQKLLLQINLELPDGVEKPRLHCLRHSFAVGTLLHWYQQGKDPGQYLIYLSTFLGHVNPESTAIYLSMTSDLLNEANQRFNQFASPLLQGVKS